MKKIFNNNRLIAIAFFTVFNVALMPSVFANNKYPVIPVELRYIGSIKNQPVFELNFSGTGDYDIYTIIIKDEEGVTLYQENIKGASFSKKFLLNTDELGDSVIRFEIISKTLNTSVLYEVNRSSKVIEQVEVTKL